RGSRLRLLADPHRSDRAPVDPRYSVAAAGIPVPPPLCANGGGEGRRAGRGLLRPRGARLRVSRRHRPRRSPSRGARAALEAEAAGGGVGPPAPGARRGGARGGIAAAALRPPSRGPRSRALRARRPRDDPLLGGGRVVPGYDVLEPRLR